MADDLKKYTKKQPDELYELKKLIEETLPREKEYKEKPKEVVKKVVAREAIPRMEDEAIEPLRRLSPEVIGTLFDRVKFLEQRITEITAAMETRQALHNSMVKEIDIDIKEKEELARGLSDLDEQRNLKLDISVLRKEKRHEEVQFWRDLLELSTELRELRDQWEGESKIADLFKELKE